MLNFFYVDYPYGQSEAFVEYEMRALADRHGESINIYTLNSGVDSDKRFVPANAKVTSVCAKKHIPAYFRAFFSMFSIESLKEIAAIIKEEHSEGFLRCLWRIYRYQLDAENFISHYKKTHKKGEKETLSSYWLNQCAFSCVKLKRKYPEIKITSRGHGYDVFRERCYLPFRHSILTGLDRIFLINQKGKKHFEDNYGEWLDMSKVEVAHLGVTIPEKMTDVDCDDVFRVVTCSSVIPLKRLDLMIDALSLIKDKRIEWVHFGAGPLFDEMKKYADEKLGDTNVRAVFMGQTPISDIQRYYATTSINLFVNCSDTEGTPVAIMEAMSYGIPTVARDVGGNSEAVSDDVGKLISPNASAEELKTAIEYFYEMSYDDVLIKRQNARKKIETEFNASITYKEYINKVSQLI